MHEHSDPFVWRVTMVTLAAAAILALASMVSCG